MSPYSACSNFAAWQIAHGLGIAARHGWAPLCAVQPMYNLLRRQAEVEILPMAEALGIAVVAYGPTARRGGSTSSEIKATEQLHLSVGEPNMQPGGCS